MSKSFFFLFIDEPQRIITGEYDTQNESNSVFGMQNICLLTCEISAGILTNQITLCNKH